MNTRYAIEANAAAIEERADRLHSKADALFKEWKADPGAFVRKHHEITMTSALIESLYPSRAMPIAINPERTALESIAKHVFALSWFEWSVRDIYPEGVQLVVERYTPPESYTNRDGPIIGAVSGSFIDSNGREFPLPVEPIKKPPRD